MQIILIYGITLTSLGMLVKKYLSWSKENDAYIKNFTSENS